MKAFVPLSHDLRRSIGHFVLNIRFFVVNFSLEFAAEVETSYGFILKVSFYEKCHQIPYKLAPPTGHWVGNLQNLFTDQLRRFQTTLKIYFQQSILCSTKHFVTIRQRTEGAVLRQMDRKLRVNIKLVSTYCDISYIEIGDLEETLKKVNTN